MQGMNIVNDGTYEAEVLRALADLVGDAPEEMFLHFRRLMDRTGLTRPQVKRACRALARKGFASFKSGLMTEDGELAGAGYSITREGVEQADRLGGCVYLIQSTHGFWRPGSAGYTGKPWEAGRYTWGDAQRRLQGLGLEKQARVVHMDSVPSGQGIRLTDPEQVG